MIIDIDVVAEHNADWIEWAVFQIHSIAQNEHTFTSDNLRSAMVRDGRTSCHPNSVGAAFKIAKQMGIIQRCGFTQSLWPTNNGRIVTLWSAV